MLTIADYQSHFDRHNVAIFHVAYVCRCGYTCTMPDLVECIIDCSCGKRSHFPVSIVDWYINGASAVAIAGEILKYALSSIVNDVESLMDERALMRAIFPELASLAEILRGKLSGETGQL